MANSYDIVVDQGSDKNLPLTFKDSDGNLLDLNGYAAAMQVRKTIEAAEAADELTTENGRITIDADAGTVTLQFPHAVTSAMAAGRYVYDLELLTEDTVTRVMEGAFILRREVTRV